MQGEEFPTQTSKGVLLNSPLRQFLVRTQKAVSLWGIRFLQSCSAFDMRSCSYPVILLKRFPDFSHRLSCNESLSVVAECDSPKFEETAAAVKLLQATEQNWSGSCGTVFYNHKGKKNLFFFFFFTFISYFEDISWLKFQLIDWVGQELVTSYQICAVFFWHESWPLNLLYFPVSPLPLHPLPY